MENACQVSRVVLVCLSRSTGLIYVFAISSVKLDIEMDPPEAPSGAKRALSPLLLSTTTKRVKLGVPLNELNVQLNHISKKELWPLRLQQESEDPSDMTSLISQILMRILSSLAATTVKDNFISSPNLLEAKKFVESFNPDERREWEDGIKMCMESGDWSDLITHRMYIVTLQDVFLTTATARLQPVAITPNEAQSETTCVCKHFCRWQDLFISQ